MSFTISFLVSTSGSGFWEFSAIRSSIFELRADITGIVSSSLKTSYNTASKVSFCITDDIGGFTPIISFIKLSFRASFFLLKYSAACISVVLSVKAGNKNPCIGIPTIQSLILFAITPSFAK